MVDKTSRKRQAVGERAGQAKLKEQQVLEIIEKHRNGQSMESLGRDYGVSATAVKYIVIGRNWSHLHKGKA